MKPDLHAQIMNLQGRPGMYSMDDRTRVAYAEGHRDARHAAAELALQADAVRDELLAALREIIAINDEDRGTFRKRGGTRQGLSIVEARAAIASATGEGS